MSGNYRHLQSPIGCTTFVLSELVGQEVCCSFKSLLKPAGESFSNSAECARNQLFVGAGEIELPLQGVGCTNSLIQGEVAGSLVRCSARGLPHRRPDRIVG